MDTAVSLEALKVRYEELAKQEREVREHINTMRRMLVKVSKERKRAADAVNSKLMEKLQ